MDFAEKRLRELVPMHLTERRIYHPMGLSYLNVFKDQL